MQPSGDMGDWNDSEPAKVKRSAILHVRVPARLKARIKQLQDFWTARAQLDDPDAKDTSEGDVVVRLMTNALEAVWKENGLPAEPSAAQVAELLETLKPEN